MPFIIDPFLILHPDTRWVPSQEELGRKAYDQLLPPLVHKIRQRIKDWRDKNYEGVSETSKALLNYWFNTKHSRNGDEFRYYFAQREAIESIIYLFEAANAKDKYELIRFDSSGRVSTGMFPIPDNGYADRDWQSEALHREISRNFPKMQRGRLFL